MAKAGAEDTATWDALQDALTRLGEIYASPDYAWEWLFPLIADRRVRHRTADGRSDGFRGGDRRALTVTGSDVSRVEVVGSGPDEAPMLSTVVLRGVRVAREDIARWCPEYGATSAPTPPSSGAAPPDVLSLRPSEAELRALPMQQQVFWTIVNRRFRDDETLALAAPGTVKRQVDLDWDAVRGELFLGCAEGPPAWKTVKSWLGWHRKLDPPR
jgi:hypothetical protein